MKFVGLIILFTFIGSSAMVPLLYCSWVNPSGFGDHNKESMIALGMGVVGFPVAAIGGFTMLMKKDMLTQSQGSKDET